MVEKLKLEKRFIRILDTNLNRCKEGLRVVEDTCRFVLCDDTLYKKIRKVRHLSSKYLTDQYEQMLNARDSIKDSGRKAKEQSRQNLRNIVIANFKRAEESLRVLEEYSKIIDFSIALKYKALRYEVYAIEKKMFLKYKNIF
ncbi:thiamine-phosphate pyrophosphorylase [Candidatus Ruminimicrobiellum ovillum]|uniref:thiamine-phosphate pyrophosphorylase n=1 Tax=Candidatus Ruminimicrobiellum ovillum TaxID=1947927 RepID=UPI003559DD68